MNVPPLRWTHDDIEQRLLFRGGKFTTANTIVVLLIASGLTLAFYAFLLLIPQTRFARDFTNQGSIPYLTVFFSAAAFAILFLKQRKLAYQYKSLEYAVVPAEHDFVLSGASVDRVFDLMHGVVDDPRHFFLFNRISIALSNLKNLAQVNDVEGILNSQADKDEGAVETSYMLLGALIWAIPVLGFIGTVLGLSDAIGGFGSVLESSGTEMTDLKSKLKDVTAGLSLAFVTTLQALVAAMFIQLWMTFQKKAEFVFLEECSNYCQRNIVNRLRLLPYESAAPTAVPPSNRGE